MSTKIPLFLTFLVSLLLLMTCGTEPPPPLWGGTTDDSLAIEELIKSNETYYSTGNFNITKDSIKLNPTLYDTISRVPFMEQVFTTDSVALRYVPDLLGLTIDNSKTKRNKDFIFTRDTTCTVVIIDSFTFDLSCHVIKACSLIYFRDTCSPTNPRKPLIDSVKVVNVSFDHTKQFSRGVAKTYLFFDSVGGSWRFAKLSPTIINSPATDSIPTVNNIKIYSLTSTRIDTVYYQTTNDSLRAMNRLHPLDSVLTYRLGDSLKFEINTSYTTNEGGWFVFYGHYEDQHKQLEQIVGTTTYNGYLYLKPTTPGYKRVYLQMLDTRSFYVPNTQNYKRDFYSTIWVIPIKVQ